MPDARCPDAPCLCPARTCTPCTPYTSPLPLYLLNPITHPPPQATDVKFCTAVYESHSKNAHLVVPKRRPREDVEFTVRHFAGDVVYSCANFLEKNNDSLDQHFKQVPLHRTAHPCAPHMHPHPHPLPHANAATPCTQAATPRISHGSPMDLQVLSTSTNAVAREIVALAEAREKAAAEGARPGAKSAAFASVSKRFVDDINTLVGALDQTITHLPTHPPTYPPTHPRTHLLARRAQPDDGPLRAVHEAQPSLRRARLRP